jgi:hypothetical protein
MLTVFPRPTDPVLNKNTVVPFSLVIHPARQKPTIAPENLFISIASPSFSLHHQ